MFKGKKIIAFLLILFCIISFSCCSKNDAINRDFNQRREQNLLTVHFINVGQADSALLVCNNHAMMIDGGNVADSKLIYTYLERQGIEYLDYIVATHAHEDHMGGLSAALVKTRVGAIYKTSVESEYKFYQNFMNKAHEEGIKIEHPISGERVSLGSASVMFLIPTTTENEKNINNSSIMTRVVFGNTSFLFTGDAEYEEEQNILNQGYDLSADVLKVGHHGADSSSSEDFLNSVKPKYAVISVGKNNNYGQPAEEVLSRLYNMDISVYRTDLQGDIVIKTDGNSISVDTNKTSAEYNTRKKQQKNNTQRKNNINDLKEINEVTETYISKLKKKNSDIQLVKVDVSSAELFSDYAFVQCKVYYAKGNEREGMLILQKKDGWEVLGIEFE